jgi:CysZ protein
MSLLGGVSVREAGSCAGGRVKSLGVGFVRGFLAPFRGGVFVARHRLWRYLVLPVVVNIALGVGTLWMAARYWQQELSTHLATSPVIAWIFLVVITALAGIVLFVLLQPLVGAVFNDRLAEKVEVKVRGSAPRAPFFASTGWALVHGLLKLVFYGLALLIGLALTAVTGLGSLVGVGLGAIFLAYDGFDYPLARRGKGFGAKWGYLLRHPGLALGYGFGSMLLYLVPLAFLVAPPFAAAGATLVFLETETKAEAKAQTKAAKAAAAAAPAPKAVSVATSAAAPAAAEKGNLS